jgi:hypothetical protein
VKQEVFVIGRDLRDLVPFSLTFMGPDFAVTLVETHDVVARATALAGHKAGWYLLILSGEDEDLADEGLERLQPATSIVIEDGDDPLIALAHLIAAARWEAAAASERSAPQALEAKEQYG